MELTLSEVVALTGGELKRDAAGLVTGVAIDSRRVQVGDLFVAIRGERFDGHRFVDDAVRAGAVGALVSDERWFPREGGAVLVRDTRRALGDLARAVRSGFDVRVAAANYNNDIGVPLTAFLLGPKTGAAVFELEMNEPGGTRRLADICRPEVGIVTNIGDSHLEAMKDRRGVAREKAELLEALPATGTAVLNADDPLVMEIGEEYCRCARVTFGLGESADLRATGIRTLGLDGVEFLVGKVEVRLPVPGRHNVYNCLAALAAARAFGLSIKASARALAGFEPPSQRLRVLRLGDGVTVVDDSYNANPQSVHAALDVLCGTECSGQRVVFLGDMLELGAESDRAHTEMGLHVASCVDRAVFIGPAGEHAVAVVIKQGVGAGRLRAYHSSADALPELVDIVRPGDTILVKGSRAMKTELIVEELVRQHGKEPDSAD
jgi:UDP-N-acetylmuramoyl-tripeptide--D-alanyl-D-alanine ligase